MNVLHLLRCAAVTMVLPGAGLAQEWHDGLCQATVDASLSFPVGGVLSKIHAKEGTRVKAGDVILELESQLESLEVSRQKLAVEAALKEYERTKAVFNKGGSVSLEAMEQKEAVWKIAVIEAEQAEAQLRRRQLAAPHDGEVIDLFHLDRGEAVAANAPAARLVDTSLCRFTAYVRGDSAHGFEKDKQVEIQFRVKDADITVTGSVEFVSPAVDAASGLLEIRAVFDNHEGKVLAGWQGKMRLKQAK